MPILRKPTIKSMWRGQTGNKFRVYEVINAEGTRFVRVNREQAYKQYNAALQVYKIRLKRMKK